MTRRRRAVLLAGLALLLGALAASDVAGREAALERRIGPPVTVVVARTALPAGTRLLAARLAVRRVPARYAPRDAVGDAHALLGLRTAVDVAPGTDLTAAMIDDGRSASAGAPGAPVRPGERVAELVALGSPQLVLPGGRVDVLVTRETRDGAGETTLALEDAEVLGAGPARAAAGAEDAGQRVAVSLRVTLRQAVYLAAAQAFAREIRLLPRAAADRRRGAAGLRVGSGL